MEITLIAAVSENGVIGSDGEMPWHYSEDLQHFKEYTMGTPVIMGRVTYESIREKTGGPLRSRTSIVLTRSPDGVDTEVPENGDIAGIDSTEVHTAGSVEEALALAYTEEADEVCVAGGASVYTQFLPVADRMVITEIHETYDGDTEFPEWNVEKWAEVERDDRDDLSFVTYDRLEP